MHNCYKFRELISNYIDQDINFNDRKFFEKHLQACSTCQQLFKSIKTTHQQLKQLSTLTVSTDFFTNLQQKILNDRNNRSPAARQRSLRFNKIPAFTYGFAGALLAVIIGFIIIQYQKFSDSQPTVEQPPIVQEHLPQAAPSPKTTSPNNLPSQSGMVSETGQNLASDSSQHKSPDSSTPVQPHPKNYQDQILPVKNR